MRHGTKRAIRRAIESATNRGLFASFVGLQGAAQFMAMSAANMAVKPWSKMEFKAAMEWAAAELAFYFPTDEKPDQNGLCHEDKAILV
jgi:hypothetical protein